MADIILAEDITDAMKARLIIEEVLGLARPQYTLRQVCRTIAMNNLTAKIPVATQLAGVAKVPELVEAPLSAQAYTELEFDLWKNVVHIAISREAQFKGQYDLMRMNVEDAAKALAKMENDQIATIMVGATDITGADWSADTNNPIDDIKQAVTAIQDLAYNPDYIVMDPVTYGDLISNSNITDVLERGTVAETGRLPAIFGLKIMVDVAVTDDTAIIIDSKAPAIMMGTGPTMVEKYTGQAAFFDGYAMGKFLEPKLVLADAIRELTGV